MHGLAYDAPDRFRRLRQDAARRHDGHGPLQRAVDLHLWRQRAARPASTGKTLTVLDSYEAVGAFMTGEIDAASWTRIERACLPTIGACAGQFTANTMAMVSEALGLTMPNVSMVPGVYAERAQIARRAGRLVMEMLRTRRPAAARNRYAQVAGERRRHRRRHRRIDQCRAASAGHRQRGRHRVHARRCRRGVRPHAADRQSAAGRQISRQGRLRYRRHGGRDPRADRERPHRRLAA